MRDIKVISAMCVRYPECSSSCGIISGLQLDMMHYHHQLPVVICRVSCLLNFAGRLLQGETCRETVINEASGVSVISRYKPFRKCAASDITGVGVST